MRLSEDPGFFTMIGLFSVIAWIGVTWEHYLKIGVYGGALALVSGGFFFGSARGFRHCRKAGWLFGWEGEPFMHWLRYSVYTSLFIGPMARYLCVVIFDEDVEKYAIPGILAGSLALGFFASTAVPSTDSE